MVHLPLPGTIRTRATASLRRPVAPVAATTAGRPDGPCDACAVASER